MSASPAVSASQVRRPWRATVRTVFQALVGLATMLPLLVNATGLDQTAPLIAGALTVSAALTRVMALPAVETWLRRFVPWLAADPDPRPGSGDGGYVTVGTLLLLLLLILLVFLVF